MTTNVDFFRGRTRPHVARLPPPLFAAHPARRLTPPFIPFQVPSLVRVRHQGLPKTAPPQRGSKRRRRVPGSGLSATSFVVPHHRTSHSGPRVPPRAGKQRRAHLPNTGFAPLPIIPRHRTARLPKMPPPARGRKRRSVSHAANTVRLAIGRRPRTHSMPPQIGRHRRPRLPCPSLGIAVIPRRKLHRGTALPPRVGHRRRSRVIAPSSPAIARRHLSRLPKGLPPLVGHRRRSKLIGTGLAAGPVYAAKRHSVRLPKMRPPDTGRHRRSKLIGTGQTARSIIPHHRTARRSAFPFASLRGKAARRYRPQAGRGSSVGGPYSCAAGQVYVAGAAAGDVSGD